MYICLSSPTTYATAQTVFSIQFLQNRHKKLQSKLSRTKTSLPVVTSTTIYSIRDGNFQTRATRHDCRSRLSSIVKLSTVSHVETKATIEMLTHFLFLFCVYIMIVKVIWYNGIGKVMIFKLVVESILAWGNFDFTGLVRSSGELL